MMKLTLLVPTSALLLLLLTSTTADIPTTFSAGQVASVGGLDCLGLVSDYNGAEDGVSRLFLTCLTDEEYQLLGVPMVDTDWIQAKIDTGDLKSGETRLRFPLRTMVDDYMLDQEPTLINTFSDDIESYAPFDYYHHIHHHDQRQLTRSRRTGDYSLAIVRVSSDGAGKSTTPTTATLQSEVLSDSNVNVVTQLSACSFDQFNLAPATGNGLDGGVATVSTTVDPGSGTIDNDTSYQQFLAYINDILDQLFDQNGARNPADFVMLCLPPNTMAGTDAIGYFNSYLTVYNSNVCTYVSFAAHEIGHNLDLYHASDTIFTPRSNAEYGDQVGYMGFSYGNSHVPQMCFNAAKSYQLGWYSSKTYTCTPSQCNPCQVDLGGIVSFDDTNVDWVLMKIDDTSSGNDYFVTYNDASGINQDTQEGANQVIINTQAREGLERNFSYLVGLLDAGDSETFANFNGVPNGEITVQVLSIANGVASVQVSTPGGSCSVPTSGPTSEPTSTPTSTPTSAPTSSVQSSVPTTSSPEEEPQVGGDPHFVTWAKEHYEFHGQCDLVLVKDVNFANGLGLHVHIRTKLVRFWSYIKIVAIQIGNEILEIQGGLVADGTKSQEAMYWINYEYQSNLETTTLSGFPISSRASSMSKSIYEIDLDAVYPKTKIIVKIYKEFLRVKLHGDEAYANTVGLLGDYETGKTFGRDGVTVLNDFVQLGNEWQVLPGLDPKLFHALEKPQFPEQCLEPENPQGERRRRLGESSVSMEGAKAACSSQLMDPLAIQDCVYDILATQDLDMVGAF